MTETEVKKFVVQDTHKAFFANYVAAPFGARLWVINKEVESVSLPTRVAKSDVNEIPIFQVWNPIIKDWVFTYTTQSLYGKESDFLDEASMMGEYKMLIANPDLSVDDAKAHYPNWEVEGSNDQKAITNFSQAKEFGNTRVFLESI